MKLFLATAMAATLCAAPVLAFGFPVSLPTLTWPTEPAITQSCTDPATLAVVACR